MKRSRRQSLGQHFLSDEQVIAEIVESTLQECRAYESVGLLEIGPGRGALTLPVLNRLSSEPQIQSFVLSEKDPYLVEDWVAELSGRAGVEVQAGDFLDLSVSKWLKVNPTVVMSNLPYSSGTAILQRLIEVATGPGQNQDLQCSHTPQIPVMILMFQAEVAERLRAEPSTSARGSLSVWVQNLWDVKKLRSVAQKSFSPPPKVMSEVVVLRRRSAPLVLGSVDGVGRSKLWQTLLQICFSQRRKMLRGLLKSHPTWQKALELSQVDGTKRAEALDWSEWNRLFQAGVQL